MLFKKVGDLPHFFVVGFAGAPNQANFDSLKCGDARRFPNPSNIPTHPALPAVPKTAQKCHTPRRRAHGMPVFDGFSRPTETQYGMKYEY
jgi:hypothetical protein